MGEAVREQSGELVLVELVHVKGVVLPLLDAIDEPIRGGDGKDAELKPVQIKTGITDGVFTEVLSGLKEGDRVVTGLAYGDESAGTARNPFAPRFR